MSASLRMVGGCAGGLLLGVAGLTGCTQDPDCARAYTDQVRVAFFVQDASNMPIQQTLAFDSVLARGKSTYLYTTEDLLDVFDLPLNPMRSSTAFLFCKDNNCQEITFQYKQQVHFVGEDCPAEIRTELLGIAAHDFEDVHIVAPELSKRHALHVRIFL